MGPIRELVTQLRFELRGLREAEQAFRGLQAKAQQVGDIKFRATGVQQVQAAIDRLRASARATVPVPVRGAMGVPAAPGIATPAVPTLPPMQLRLRGVEEARAALASLRDMGQRVAGVVAGIGASLGVQKLIEAGDEQAAHFNRLRAELEGTKYTAESVYERIFAMSRQTGVGMDAGVQGFTRIHNAVKDLGYDADQVLRLVEGFQKSGTVIGAKPQDIAEVVRQMGQAFGQGRLYSDELRVLMERMGPLGRELAAQLGEKAGALKKLGSEGKLPAERVFPAFLKALDAFEQKFGRMQMTLSRARGISGVVFTRFLADLDQAIELTPTLARGLLRISEWADGLRSKLSGVRQFVRDLGGMKSILEVTAIAAGLATAAFFRLGASLVIPGAVVLGIATVAALIQDLWYWASGRKGSLAGDLFGDFEPVRQRAVAALDGVRAKLGELRDEVVTGFGFRSTGELFDDVQRRFTAFTETTKREWEAVRAFFASDTTAGVFADTVRGMGDNARAMWEVVGPIIRGLIGGPSEMAKEWAGFAALFKDPLALVGSYFDDLSARVARVAERLRELFGLKPPEGFGAGLSALSKESTAETRNKMMDGIFGPGGTDRRRLFGPSTTPAAPGAAPAPMNDLGLPGISPMSYDPMGYMRDLPLRMGRAQTIAASQAVTINAPVTVNATGVSGAEVAAATQKGMGRAMEGAFEDSGALARNMGFNFARTELAAT